jgi:hypothetical protein
MVRLVVSQWSLDPTKLVSAEVKTTFHDRTPEALTVYVVLLVLKEMLCVPVSVPEVYPWPLTGVPVQSEDGYRVIEIVPDTTVLALEEVMVAVSFGSQSCALVAVVVSVTVKHSAAGLVSPVMASG